jgi:hypothetical protein
MNTPTLVVILLTVLSILIFLKTVPFIFLSSNMLNLDKYFGINIEIRLDLFDSNDIVQNLFSGLLIIIAVIIVYKRQFQGDIINYIMYYFITLNIIRFYFVFFTQSKLTELSFKTIGKITMVTMFLLSAYSIKYIFF